MWRWFQNTFHSLKTYTDLSPDLRTRRRVNQFLHARPSLSAIEWYERFWRSQTMNRQLVDFVYCRLATYSGIDFSRVQPGDRINDDLHLPLVCWFDWQLSLRDDFLQEFGIDLGDQFNLETFSTLTDLMLYLNQHLVSINHL